MTPAESLSEPISDVAVPSHDRALPADDAEGRDLVAPEAVPVAAAAPVKTKRIVSLDALRGFTMMWILGGDGLAWSLQQMSADKGPVLSAIGNFIGQQFTHVEWEGFRFYDLILPLLIFATGVAIVLSLGRLVAREGRLKAHRRVLRRALLLFALGIVFYGGMSNAWPDIRLLGVLQRIALCYLFASLLFLNFQPRGMAIALAGLLLGYWALLTFVPVPGVGAGSYAKDANLANWIDLHYLPGKKWSDTWDPEGLLSTLPAIATCLIGVFAGMLLVNPRIEARRKSRWLVGAGILTALAGHLWGLQFPIIKAIWTSSFVLVTGGYSLVLLGVFHHLFDVKKLTGWSTVFVWIGANAIMLYFLNDIASFEQFAARLAGGDVAAFLDSALTPGAGRFAIHAIGLAVVIAIARFFYRREIFLRV
ncbi:MAG: DUF5009 domain-containing protein [Variibacter sp.]|nr:DUF5009 domain-containing protein [Variibacter sp.]